MSFTEFQGLLKVLPYCLCAIAIIGSTLGVIALKVLKAIGTSKSREWADEKYQSLKWIWIGILVFCLPYFLLITIPLVIALIY